VKALHFKVFYTLLQCCVAVLQRDATKLQAIDFITFFNVRCVASGMVGSVALRCTPLKGCNAATHHAPGADFGQI
jgi:hypothetical protein